ncbi:mitochondrial intermediate peptidase, partial [Agrilus planipennis]|uniref:Mitochondrial intermediate peptidase n=1 Tax=Agrilus planipennis TaxID=224129 RepID=A0A1W4XJ91_AGRPL
DLAEFIRIAHPQNSFASSAEEACVSVSGLVEKLNTNLELYKALKEVVDNGDLFKTDKLDNHVAQLFLFDFQQCGIHLPEAERKKVVLLNDTILQVGQQFMANAGAPRRLNKDVLPLNIQDVFPIEGDNALVSGLFAESPNPVVREVAYYVYLHADKRQEHLLNELLKNRYELAVTCGFPTYAHRALRGSTTDTPEAVLNFLNILSRNIKYAAAEDFKRMEILKHKELGSKRALEIWDIPYYTQKAKKEWFKVNASDYCSYFSLGTCMDGLNTLFKNLFGISLINVETKSGEVWANDIYKLAVVHETEGLLGHIYCDFYERTGKPNQECHFTIVGGRETSSGEYQQPVV